MNIYYDPSASSAFLPDIRATIPKNYLKLSEYAECFQHTAVLATPKCEWTDEMYAAAVIRAKKQWQDSEYRDNMLASRVQKREERKNLIVFYWAIAAYWGNPEPKATRSELTKKQWQDPEFRAKKVEDAKKQSQDPECKAKRAVKSAAYWAKAESKAKRSELTKKQWQDPEFRAKQMADRARKREEKKNLIAV